MALQLLDKDRIDIVADSALEGVDGGDVGTTYTYRQIPPDVNRSLSKKHTTRPINRKTGARETEIDNIALLDDLVDFLLVDWSGILHKGQPVPCTREYKLLLDYPRKAALLTLAGLNQVSAEVEEASFRGLAPVL